MALTRFGSVALALGIAAFVTTGVGAQDTSDKSDKADKAARKARHAQGGQGNTKPKGETETVNKTVAFPSVLMR